MSRIEWLVTELYSRRRLDVDFAACQLKALARFEQGIFCPERCDVYEPLKEKFDVEDLSEPIRWLVQPGGEFKFRRSRPFRIQGYISNTLFPQMKVREDRSAEWQDFKPSVSEPQFCTHWAVWIDSATARKKGTGFIKSFLVEMFQAAEADYGFLTAESDHKRKNFLVTREAQGTLERFVGDNPERGLPGIYWMNLFGPLYVEWFGRERIKSVPATIIEEYPDGSVFLQFGDSPEDVQSADVLWRQRVAVGLLGDQAFFDIARPTRDLAVPTLIDSRSRRER